MSTSDTSNAQVIPDADKFTFHVYVDPIYGDDAMAYHENPGKRASTPIERAFLADYPKISGSPPFEFPDPNTPGEEGFLQHAPYSFRTLTGGTSSPNFGALAYIADRFPPPFPDDDWTNIDTGKRVDWIVIHCLPGLYGPDSTVDPSLSDFDLISPTTGNLASTLRFNGELFPIELRDRVAIQGTSALDTMFDARETETAVFRAWEFNGVTGLKHGPTFVDSITVRGARSNSLGPWTGGVPNDTGAAFSFGFDTQPADAIVSTLYRNTSHPTFPGGVLDGTINPPGTWRTPTDPPECGSLQPSGYLASPPSVPLGSFGCAPSTTYAVGTWGYGDSNCPGERLPLLFEWLGVRFNCQVFAGPGIPDRSNLQTFLTVIGDNTFAGIPQLPTAQAQSSPHARSSRPYPGPRANAEQLLGTLPPPHERLDRMLEIIRWYR